MISRNKLDKEIMNVLITLSQWTTDPKKISQRLRMYLMENYDIEEKKDEGREEGEKAGGSGDVGVGNDVHGKQD